MRKAPQIIIAVILLIFFGWGGYWFVGAQATERVLTGWFEDRRAEGWTADYESLNTAGFPSRFDTTVTDLTLVDPDTGLAWSAPLFQALSLSYRPTDVIAVLPGEQVFGTRDRQHRITSEDFRASLTLRPSVELPVAQSVVEIDTATVASSDGTTTGIGHAQFSMRETPGRQGHVYDFDLSATDIHPDPSLTASLPNAGAIADVIERAHVRATIRFDAGWDRFALERARPQPREIELTDLALDWGGLMLDAAGTLVVGQSGVAEGTVDVKAENWRDMVALGATTGAIPEMLVATVTRAGEMLSRMSGDPETLDVTLRFENGRAFLGPIPLGAAPVIRLP